MFQANQAFTTNNAIYTRGLMNTGYTVNNWDSGWFFVGNNSDIPLTTLGYTANLLFPPKIMFLFCPTTNNPVLGTDAVYYLDNNTMVGTSGYGIGRCELRNGSIFITTGASGLLYDSGGSITVNYTSGYLRVLIYN